MLRLTSRREFIAAIVLVALGALNILLAQATGFQGFPGFLSLLLILCGIYIGLLLITKAPRDLGTSFVLVLIGATGLYFGAELTMGTAGRMGPGYFPRLLSWLIIAIGIGVGSMALTVEGPPIDPPKFRPISFVLLSIVVFGYMMAYVGLIVTAFVMVLVAALARQEFKLGET